MRLILTTILLLLSLLLFPQVYERYLEEETEISYPNKFEVLWANDVFFQTDRYYTNGLAFEYFSQDFGQFALAGLLFDPMSESGPVYSMTLSHDIFTPMNVFGDPAQNDRPYAGVLMAGLKAMHFSPEKQYRFYSEIQAGLLGEYAGGRFVQNGIHVLLPDSEPIPGWAYQIDHDLCIQYITGLEKLLLGKQWFEADLLAKGRLGLPYSDFSGGARIRAGKAPGYYTTDHLLSKKHNYIYFFAEAILRTILYDATLQGGAFNDKNPHTIINSKPLAGEYKMGIAVRFNNLTAETGARFVTPKFYGADSHKWAYFKFGILF